MGTSALLAFLGYLNMANTPGQVFDWLVNIINTAGFTSWICCCVIFLRFRKACAAQGVTDLPYKSATQPYMAWVCLISFSLLSLLNGFDVFFPGKFSASSLLSAYIGIPIFLAFYAVHRVFHWKEPWVWKPEDVDLHTGLQEVLATQAADAEAEEEGKPKWYKKDVDQGAVGLGLIPSELWRLYHIPARCSGAHSVAVAAREYGIATATELIETSQEPYLGKSIVRSKHSGIQR